MEMGEGVKAQVNLLKREKDPTCSKQDQDPGWSSRVNRWGTLPTCTGARLYENMRGARRAHEERGLGVVPDRDPAAGWTFEALSPTTFPVQAHHLIPKNYLPDHRVCVWLAKKYSKNKAYKLRFDSNYDNDDERNGYCMPYARPLREWKRGAASHTEVAFRVMDETEIQLHQSSHADVLDARRLSEIAGRPVTPEIHDTPQGDDDAEEPKCHVPGYLDRVGRLLNVVDQKALKHAQNCGVCKARTSKGKTEVLPSEDVANLMHRASAIMKVMIDTNLAHVSAYAYCHAVARGKVRVKKGRIHL